MGTGTSVVTATAVDVEEKIVVRNLTANSVSGGKPTVALDT